MGFLGLRARALVARLWRNDAPLTATAAVMLVAFAACVVGLLVDQRVVLGAPVWLKPAKFAISIAVYCLTLAAVFEYIPSFARTRRSVGSLTALAMLLEMAIISGQAARGTTSHFNVSTPFNAALFAIMGVAIVTQTLSTVAVAVALFRQRFEDPSLGWALRLGLVLTIAGALLGGVMTRPTHAQLDEMHQGRVAVSGAHTVGAPDGGPGMPGTGWSREHGDLRAPHFFGLHALQILPLLALGLRRTPLGIDKRTRLVVTFAASYGTFVGILCWQALHGRPLLAPDAGGLAALVTWLGATVLFTGRAVLGNAPASTATRNFVPGSPADAGVSAMPRAVLPPSEGPTTLRGVRSM
jgi:hypothetical protein